MLKSLIFIVLLLSLQYFTLVHPLQYNESMTTGCLYDSGFCNCLFPNNPNQCYNPSKTSISIMLGRGNWYATESNLGNYSCKTTNCHMYEGSGKNDSSHVMVGSSEIKNYPKQLKFDFKFENDFNDVPDDGPNDFFDLFVSFRRVYKKNLWQPLSYINADLISFRNKGAPFEIRSNNLSMFVGNFNPRSRRNEIFGNLSIHYKIQSFGQYSPPNAESVKNEFSKRFPLCFGLYRRSAMWDSEKECVYFYSKLALAFENSHGPGYLTEKIWQPLKMGAIPVVLGKQYVQPFLPHPHAAIYVDDFNSTKELAEYLHQVVKDKSLWYKHTGWKDQSISSWSSKFKAVVQNSYANMACVICEAAKKIFYSEFSFERFIAPIRLCVYDSFVLESVRGHDTVHPHKSITQSKVTDVLTHSLFDSVYVVGYHDKARKSHIHDTVQAIKSVFSVHPVVVDLYEPTLIKSDTPLLQCFNEDNDGSMSMSMSVLSMTLKHLYVYYRMLDAGFDRVLVIDAGFSFHNSTVHKWSSKEIQHAFSLSTTQHHELYLISNSSEVASISSLPSPHIDAVPSSYIITRAGALRIFEALVSPLSAEGIISLLCLLNVTKL